MRELAPVRLGAPEDNFADIVDLALMAAQNQERDLDRTMWDLVTGNVKTAEKVITMWTSWHRWRTTLPGGLPGGQVQRPRDRTPRAREGSSGAHRDRHQPGEGDGRPGQEEAVVQAEDGPVREGPAAWTQRDFERLLEVSVLHEPRRLAQRCLGAERRIRGTIHGMKVNATLMTRRQLERIQQILRRLWPCGGSAAPGRRAIARLLRRELWPTTRRLAPTWRRTRRSEGSLTYPIISY